MNDFTLTSSAFEQGGEIPARHGCDGEDAPVPLEWSGTPDGTAELALVMDDPDAGGFVHWLVTGIPGEARRLDAAALPAGASEGRNDFGRAGYGGPCPPSGTHRYVFTLYALPEPLDVGASPGGADVRSAAADRALAQAALSGQYSRGR